MEKSGAPVQRGFRDVSKVIKLSDPKVSSPKLVWFFEVIEDGIDSQMERFPDIKSTRYGQMVGYKLRMTCYLEIFVNIRHFEIILFETRTKFSKIYRY